MVLNHFKPPLSTPVTCYSVFGIIVNVFPSKTSFVCISVDNIGIRVLAWECVCVCVCVPVSLCLFVTLFCLLVSSLIYWLILVWFPCPLARSLARSLACSFVRPFCFCLIVS